MLTQLHSTITSSMRLCPTTKFLFYFILFIYDPHYRAKQSNSIIYVAIQYQPHTKREREREREILTIFNQIVCKVHHWTRSYNF